MIEKWATMTSLPKTEDSTATITTATKAAVMIQQQQLVIINLLFPLLLSNTDISHGGDLKPKVGDAVEKYKHL